MAKERRLRHNDDYFSREMRRRLNARLLGENVAFAPSIDEAHRRLMASEGHRSNILNARFTIVGVGTVFDEGRWWITEDFVQLRAPAGSPRAPDPLPGNELLRLPPAQDDTGVIITVHATPEPTTPIAGTRNGEVIRTARATMLDGRPRDVRRHALPVSALAAGLLVLVLWLGLGLRWFIRQRGVDRPGEGASYDTFCDPTAEHLMRSAINHAELKTKLAANCGWSLILLERWNALAEPDRRSIVDILARTSREAATMVDQLPLCEPWHPLADDVGVCEHAVPIP